MSGEGISMVLLQKMSSSRAPDGDRAPDGSSVLRYTAITRNFGWVCGAIFALFLIGPSVFPPSEPMTPHELNLYRAIFGGGVAVCVAWSLSKQDRLTIHPWGLSYERLWWQNPARIQWEELSEIKYYGTGSVLEGILVLRSREGDKISFGALYMHGMQRLRKELEKRAAGPLAAAKPTPGFDRGLPPSA